MKELISFMSAKYWTGLVDSFVGWALSCWVGGSSYESICLRLVKHANLASGVSTHLSIFECCMKGYVHLIPQNFRIMRINLENMKIGGSFDYASLVLNMVVSNSTPTSSGKLFSYPTSNSISGWEIESLSLLKLQLPPWTMPGTNSCPPGWKLAYFHVDMRGAEFCYRGSDFRWCDRHMEVCPNSTYSWAVENKWCNWLNFLWCHVLSSQHVDASTFFKRISPLHYSSAIRSVHVCHVAKIY